MVQRKANPGGSAFAWLAALLSLAAGVGSAHAQTRLSLQDAIDRAVERNAGLRAAQSGVDVADAQVAQARSALLPRLDFIQSYVRTDHPVQAFGARLAQQRLTPSDLSPDALNEPDPIDDWVSRLELRVPVVHVASWYGLRAAALGEDTAQAARRSAEARTVADTVAAYYQVQLSDAHRQVAQQTLQAAETDLERVRAHRAAGTATETDVAGIQTEVASLREQLIRAESAATIARARLARVMGSPVDGQFTLSTPLRKTSRDPSTAVSLQPDHPQLVRSEAAVAGAEAQRAEARASYAPTLSLMAAVEHHSEDFAESGGDNYLVGVDLRVNLFGGGADWARTRRAEAELARARAMQDDARAELELRLVEARRSVQDAEALSSVTAEAVEHARLAHRLERARFEVGMSQTSDLLRSRSAMLRAEQRHLQAIFARRMAAVRLAAATGTLDRNFRESTP